MARSIVSAIAGLIVSAPLVLFDVTAAPAANLATLEGKIASWERTLSQIQRLASSSGDAATLQPQIADVRTALAGLKAQLAELKRGPKRH